MTVFILCCALPGAVLLRLRFMVPSLIPATGLMLVVIVFTGVARGDGAWAILAGCAAAVTALQIGYLARTLAQVSGAAQLRRAWMRTTATPSGQAR